MFFKVVNKMTGEDMTGGDRWVLAPTGEVCVVRDNDVIVRSDASATIGIDWNSPEDCPLADDVVGGEKIVLVKVKDTSGGILVKPRKYCRGRFKTASIQDYWRDFGDTPPNAAEKVLGWAELPPAI